MNRGYSGLSTWVIQRVGAICMLVLLPLLLWALLVRPAQTYAEWKAWVGQPTVAAALLVFFIALLSHMWVGLRDVLLDYAKPAGVRTAAVIALAVALVFIAGWLALTLYSARI